MGPSPVASNDASQITDKVTDLVVLLDRYLYLTGNTLATGRELQPSDRMPQLELFSPFHLDVPVALQTYVPVPLASHLHHQETDVAAARTLEQRLHLFHILAPPVVIAAHARLKAEYATCTPTPSPSAVHAFALKGSLADKLATLRTHQHHNPPEYQVPHSRIVVIKSLDSAGNAAERSKLYLPKDTDWTCVSLALQRATICSQTEHAGFPTGYPLHAGAWLIQRTRNNIPASSSPTHALRNATNFRTLRLHMDSDERMGVLVWHERLWAQSRKLRDEARKESCEVREWVKLTLGEEIRYPDGEMYFEPGFGHELNWEGVHFDSKGLADMTSDCNVTEGQSELPGSIV